MNCRKPRPVIPAPSLALCQWWHVLVGLVALTVGHRLTAGERADVLVLHSYHPEYAWTAAQAGGIDDGLSASNGLVRWYSEYLDARRTPFSEVEGHFSALLEAKYRDRRFAAVIATDRRAVEFVLHHRAALAPMAELVFSGITLAERADLDQMPGWSGVLEGSDVGSTLDLIRALLPETRNVLVVYNEPNPASGSRVNSPRFNEILAEHSIGLVLTRYQGFRFSQLSERVSQFAENTVVVVDAIAADIEGGDFSPERVRELGRSSRMPIFTPHEEVFLHAGVGGMIRSGREIGTLAARLALERIAKPGAAPVLLNTPLALRVRQGELERWGIPEKRVPASAVILDRAPGILVRFGREIAIAGVLILGLAVSVILLVRSVLQRRRALARIRESENLYRSLIEQSPDAILLMEGAGPSRGTILSVNSAGAALQGYTPAELVGMRIQDLLTPESFSLVEQRLDRLYAGEALVLRLEHLHRDRSLLPLEINARVIQWNGRPCVLSVERDARVRVRQEHRFRELAGQVAARSGEEFLQAVVAFLAREFSMDFVGITLRKDVDSPMLFTRAAILQGQTEISFKYAMQGTPCEEVIQGRVVQVLSEVARAYPKDTFFQEYGFQSYFGVPLRATNGQVLGLIGCAAGQASDAAMAEEILAVLQVLAHSVSAEVLQIDSRLQLEASERHHRQLIERSPVGIALIQDGELIYSNPAAGELSAVPGEVSLLGRPATDFMVGSDRLVMASILRRVQDGEPVPAVTEARLQRLDGTTIPVEIRAVRTSFRGRPAVAALITDLSERVRAEEERRRLEMQLRQASRLEAVGTLTGGIAHDFNNLLTAILGNLEIAERLLPEGSTAREHLSAVRGPADRARSLVARMMAFVRKGESRRTAVDLAKLVHEMVELLRPTLPVAIEVRENFEEALPAVQADASQFHQVVLNLCSNAVQAMEGMAGVLEVGLAHRVVTGPEAVELRIRPGSYVELRVRDSGIGMSPSIQERVFEPFFTTKPAGKGTGLGLAMVQGTVAEHQGAVRITSAVGLGTTFRILLPVTYEPQVCEPESRAPQSGKGECILVVDDEPAVAHVATRFLENLGYRAVSCTDPRQVPGLIRGSVVPFDAVISDLTMPHWNGIALLAEIRRVAPTLPVLLSSGFSGTLTEEGARETGFAGLLHKPYSLNRMAQAIHAVLHPSGVDRNEADA